MAGEDVSEPSRAPDNSLEGWLDEKAEELGVSREELLAKVRNGDAPDSLDGADGADGKLAALRRELIERLAATEEEFQGELADLRSELGEVERDVGTVEREFDEKIDDVRERIIQVKREADAKAPAEHDHPDLRQRTESVADRADRLADELDGIAATVEDLDEQVDAGFENYEDVLEYLTDATDELESKLTTLAEVTVDLRDQTQALAARHASRTAADELAHLANRRGVEEAKCGHCGETVHVGLLAEPKCPHCASTFNDVEPKQGFFGSAKLAVGDPPALEGERADWDVGSVFGSDVATEDLDDLLGEDDE
ncbi:CopG family transcriptional regulator [Halorussus litoreus]|uniref:CopG family transcriptional regulator n=1 Tax=Halorussus litoreus TaxID=1710536 RepID=UPI000E27FE2C|nr:CopG family transcriptional regulator [Halorussus litoreus]